MTAVALATRLLQYSALLPHLIDAEPFLQFAVTLQGRIYPPLLAASGAMFCIGLAWFTFLKLHLRKGEQRLRQTNQKSLPQQAVGRADQYRQGFQPYVLRLRKVNSYGHVSRTNVRGLSIITYN
ncbi:uncharacterized protein BDR25DRAFT_363675 [Lindgomyces ingoldianus]|uniref:Uncharacterized protein n=1 Tax=Lindgomyces ingoldianus TaxID=673940 RepID=A0ACB6Q794_9PLEO|nr:uncharacterized protein BDR25DRAFT_363675 [Lindgomyces ingoldianus]KAF2462706.1 hypothetical protein BDR25DRAFT_363675 [Lindgomyces ingoldianus]